MAKRKVRSPRPASPLEVARTLLARAKELTTISASPEAAEKRQPDVTLRSRTESGVQQARREAPTVSETPKPGRVATPEPEPALERYQAVGPLGQGGMGRVDEVYDGLLGRCVAKKALLSNADEERATMLIAEAQTCAQLEHPSIVPVYDVGSDEQGNPFYTMRVVRGRTLRDLLDDNIDPDREHVPLAQVLGIFRQVCLAVDYAHSRRVVHRDLKPDNVVLGEFGEVYVVDWGIAHVQEGSSVYRASSGPMIAGTPGYMAPEQLLGESVDGRADVFSLGVMLYEILCGARPFTDSSIQGVINRRDQLVDVPPSRRDPHGQTPGVFDDLVLSCLAPDRSRRPVRARAVADAIDAFLDGERARAEREREADAYAREGNEARAAYESLDRRAHDLAEQAEKLLAGIPAWASADKKDPAWTIASESRRLGADAARALAKADTAYTRALGRVANHSSARRGLAALYYRQFEAAEAAGDHEQMAQFIDLARAYDDGYLALELANQGELSVESRPSGALVSIERYEPSGPLLRLVPARELGAAPTQSVLLDAGSYLVTARLDGREARYPLCIRRAMRCLLKLSLPKTGEVPDDMILVPGGPFRGLLPGASRLSAHSLQDFAIGKFPVTARQYAAFLDDLDEHERARRAPQVPECPYLVREASGWRLGPHVIEGEARARVPAERELEVPVVGLRWYDAVAYTEWLARRTGRPYRLPSDLEWEKAMRGADGRSFPMGTKLDPAFAKTRESRPEPPQLEPVGAFPLDESPYLVRDLAGGVGDWTSTSPDGLPPPSLSDEGRPEADDRQMFWRGASWSSAASAQADMRYPQAVRWRVAWIGFRLALGLDSEGSSELIVEPMKKQRA